ncbi:MAG: WecB/TagA/CpsF family glycosyltransferase, partial [Muribaculaceae bacterium]|nr:WecB/TagA/CpsF family glycosyltransferase [Muribaculaceae bacterium]
LGSTAPVVEETARKLRQEFPGINIAGVHDGYLTSEALKSEVISDIVSKKPDVVFVAMGSPRQELLMDELRKIHPALYMGLGGSFDIYTGRVKRAPKWWVDHNLEFAYRLVRQPKRFRRQIHLVRFLWLLLTNKL